MTIRNVFVLCWMLALVGGLVVSNGIATGADSLAADVEPSVNEMPVLTGSLWQKMSADEKIAFVWGIGHVVTVEWQVAQRYPGMARSDFAAKLAEGLAGVSMNDIVHGIDTYYKENPDDLAVPALEVIWAEMVKPKLHTGIGDLPLT